MGKGSEGVLLQSYFSPTCDPAPGKHEFPWTRNPTLPSSSLCKWSLPDYRRGSLRRRGRRQGLAVWIQRTEMQVGSMDSTRW
jgi:hypothetical protein